MLHVVQTMFRAFNLFVSVKPIESLEGEIEAINRELLETLRDTYRPERLDISCHEEITLTWVSGKRTLLFNRPGPSHSDLFRIGNVSVRRCFKGPEAEEVFADLLAYLERLDLKLYYVTVEERIRLEYSSDNMTTLRAVVVRNGYVPSKGHA